MGGNCLFALGSPRPESVSGRSSTRLGTEVGRVVALWSALRARKQLSTLWTAVWITGLPGQAPVDELGDGGLPRCVNPRPPTRHATPYPHRRGEAARWVRPVGSVWTRVEMWTNPGKSRQTPPSATENCGAPVDGNVDEAVGSPRPSTRSPRPRVLHAVHSPTATPTLKPFNLSNTEGCGPEPRKAADRTGADWSGVVYQSIDQSVTGCQLER